MLNISLETKYVSDNCSFELEMIEFDVFVIFPSVVVSVQRVV